MTTSRRRPTPPATISDVARAAGVSPATVSRTLNGSASVSADKSARVRKVAIELGYQPFGPAQALRQQRTSVWAAIVADIENPFFTSVVRGMEDGAAAAGYRVVLCNTDEDLAKESAYLGVVIAERMAGVVIAVASTSSSSLDLLLDSCTPVVAIDRFPEKHAEFIDSVLVDTRAGANEGTEHLLAGGSLKIACITGPTEASTANDRLAGYESALRSSGRKVDRTLIRRADFRERGGYQATRSLLARAEPPDAILIANNLMALGALRAIRESGRRIPDDLAVVSFDDAPWTTLVDPALTVVAQPTYEIGRQAAALLASADSADEPRHILLHPSLIVRASSTR